MAAGAEVVIAGGGICGCLTAYMLARVDVPTVVVQRDRIGDQASGFNSGTLGPLLGAGLPGPLSDMAMAAFNIHQDLFDDWGPDRPESFRPLARLHLGAGDGDEHQLRQIIDQYSRHQGFSAEYLRGAELARLEPRLNARFTSAVVTHGDLTVDGREYTRAMAARAQRAGASILHDEVRAFDHTGTRATAVRCGGRVIPCGAVVIAAGPWSASLAGRLDYELPCRPIKGEMLRFASPPPRHDISYNGMSCYGRGHDRIWAGSTNEDAGFDLSPTAAARERIERAAFDLLPDLGGATLDSHTVALREVSADGLPICGAVPGWENVYVIAGGGSKGLLLSAFMARTICGLIAGTADVSIALPASPRRFTARTR